MRSREGRERASRTVGGRSYHRSSWLANPGPHLSRHVRPRRLRQLTYGSPDRKNDLRRTTTAHPRTSRVVASVTESVMYSFVSTRRPLAGVALLVLAACQGDPITAIDPSAAPALAIAPGDVTITDLGLPAGLTDIYPTAINEAGIVLAADAAGGYIYRVGVWSE